MKMIDDMMDEFFPELYGAKWDVRENKDANDIDKPMTITYLIDKNCSGYWKRMIKMAEFANILPKPSCFKRYVVVDKVI